MRRLVRSLSIIDGTPIERACRTTRCTRGVGGGIRKVISTIIDRPICSARLTVVMADTVLVCPCTVLAELMRYGPLHAHLRVQRCLQLRQKDSEMVTDGIV